MAEPSRPRRARSPRAARRPDADPALAWRPGEPGRAALERWFASRGWTPWPFQRAAWDAHATGRSGLIEVPTGAGKTYAAFGGALAHLLDDAGAPRPAPAPGEVRPGSLRVLYLTPLRAVARDIELALRAPVEALGLPWRVEGRTGDTTTAARARQRVALPEVLVTTPESLTLLLASDEPRALFAGLHAVIVDEWHDLLATKRGTQVELALARLRTFAPALRVWGMSATIPNVDDALATLLGAQADASPRAGALVRGGMSRPIHVDSVLPSDPRHLPWAGHLGLTMLPDVLATLDPATPTIVFTNTRSQAERWFHALAWSRPAWEGVLALHHGSLDRDERERVEAGLKDGTIRIVVATSSLDLGVDFAPVERVLQIGSPKGIARVAQRAGRAAHRPMAPCRITCVPTHAMELVEIAAARAALHAGDLEPRSPHERPIDVLAQHLVTCALGGGFQADDLYAEVRTAWSYRALDRRDFDHALTLVTNGGVLHAYPDFTRVVREPDGSYRVRDRRIAQRHRMNVGTIVSDSTIEIRYVGGRSLGRIEEHFVGNLREGERFVYAGKVLQFAFLRDMIAYVRAARGSTSLTPIWGGTRLPISESLAQAIREALQAGGRGEFATPEMDAARPLIETQRRLSALPDADETLAEIHDTREGRHLYLFPFEGRLVHTGLAALIALRLTRRRTATLVTSTNDYGLEILAPKAFPFEDHLAADLFSPEHLAADALESVNSGQLARLQFREIARVSGLVMENDQGRRKTGRQTMASAGLLFDVLSEHDAANPLLEQARREVLERHFEGSRLARTLARLSAGALRLTRPARLTPLSFPLLIERQSALLSSETIAQRVEAMRREWQEAASRP
ncbi:MAG: ligase-associated DNA damage response DEXH box helicase [Planctomycetota bacterium]|nr:ligase-associated DNA damage response DEXH box helicase [Planctomycetota bacterium]